ncbi:uncharacterized protein TEOVI_000684900 [Trypanosoma equiperdum]|uniref:Uncharacterized protein n=2 Tax=Trypanozoon TaxID=39700 RepID=Q57WU2_TRYB2|nr:hypothetical protein, conserved [Trypanosoma brucei brucei TREU927]AAX69957.1 hypothetical protein, conserved [Trypanosoma brucei]AAZ12173.1 hypothetical protein, conserved [Trypanosoma brucei brucei TREU927]SCU67222.1 hypothetical protein, conserved [Trypanosoma equiperdum]
MMQRCGTSLSRLCFRRLLRTPLLVYSIPPIRDVPSGIAHCPLSCSMRMVTSSNDDEFVFDPTLSIQKDAAIHTAKKSFETIVLEYVPAHAPEEARQKVKSYLTQHPIDILITQPKVQITHLEDAESGAETKVSLSPCDLPEALQQARERGMNLVQMGARGDVAYCRIRRESARILSLIHTELEALREQEEKQQGKGRGGVQAAAKMGELIDHTFRDAVDAHFVGWRSKKIVEDIRRRHPVKLTIKEFQSPECAIGKLREMCQAMQHYAQEKVIYHHFTSIVANDREASITFAPALPMAKSDSWKHIKYPGEKEWTNALRRMEDACRKSGRYGTYAKSNKLKLRSLGQTSYRVDKYGRKMD